MCERCGGQFGVCDMTVCKGDAILPGCGVSFQLEPGQGETAFCMACLEKREALGREPDRYRVLHGWSDYAEFGRFEDAVAFYAKTPGAGPVLNMARYDGAPDGSDGLTEEQRTVLGL